MQSEVHIVTGFLGAGKTSFIQQIVDEMREKYQNDTVVLQMEAGEENLSERAHVKKFVFDENKGITRQLEEIINHHDPDQIILEHNNMKVSLEEIFQVLEDKPLRRKTRLKSVNGLVDGKNFSSMTKNLGEIFTAPLFFSDHILITHQGENDEKGVGALAPEVERQLKQLNPQAVLFAVPNKTAFQQLEVNQLLKLEPDSKLATWDKIGTIALLFLFTILLGVGISLSLMEMQTTMHHGFVEPIEVFLTLFLGLLIQAFPFLLIGTLVSAFVQVFVSRDAIARVFPGHPVAAIGIATIAGVFFPICDCAIVPVSRRLLQKGVPLSAGVTFLAAAPVVDPVVILSTYYAFPTEPAVPLMRVLIGVVIAVLLGVVFHFFPGKSNVIRENTINYCQCGYCASGDSGERGKWYKIKGALKHASNEFFMVGKFLIIAAAVSTFLQSQVAPESLALLTETRLGALLFMMLLAFILSICSTSDAFIARNLVHHFQIESVMGFMVFGALLDVKNMSLLLNSFNKRFVIRLAATFSLLCLGVLLLFFSG